MKMELNLFPAPRNVSEESDPVDLSQADWIILPNPCSESLLQRVKEAVATLSSRLDRSVRFAAAPPQEGTVLLSIHTGAEMPPQGFKLTLKDAPILEAGNEAGAFYGLLAFMQLLEQFGTTPPGVVINDSPDFPTRGVMLDVARCKVPTLATCKQLIDRLAGIRINQIQLYIEHTFAFSAHKTVWADASPFTHEDILELSQYCADRFMELVPNLNSFGHFERWLKHPKYKHLAECPDVRRSECLCPNTQSIEFLNALYDEYLPNFGGSLFNVGCDETNQLGTGRSRERAEKTSVTAVYLEFLKQIHELVASKGRRMQFWGDIILRQPELIKELPQNILALCFGYCDDHPFEEQCRAFSESGIEFHVCPGTSSWLSITGRTDNCLANLESAAKYGLRYGATGYLNTDWGDSGHHQVLPISYLGFAAGAAYSWHLETNREVDLAGALDRHFFEDSTSTLGQFMVDLGLTRTHLPGLLERNCGAIHQLLFDKVIHGITDISGITADQYGSAEAWLDRLESTLQRARPMCADKDLVMVELRHTLGMSRYALHRGRYASFGAGTLEQLHAELDGLVIQHEKQWLARNRPGGLPESTGKLLQTAELVGIQKQRE